MFKPSLKKSILKDNFCFPEAVPRKQNIPNSQQTSFLTSNVVKNNLPQNFNVLPSMLLPEELLQDRKVSNDKNYSHIFTPLSYDFKPYPQNVREIIKHNPDAAFASKIGKISYILFEKTIALWRQNHKTSKDIVFIHQFPENIDIAQCGLIQNSDLFRFQSIKVIAIAFKNRITLYKISEDNLCLQDLMLRYKLRSCRKIQKIIFTPQNQIVFSGDSGQISMVSFNTNTQIIVNVLSPFLKKYFSKNSFDYFTEHKIKQICIGDKFLYCLHDRLSRSNWLLYTLRKIMNKVVTLKNRPQYISEQTFLDVYRLENDRTSLIFTDRIKQNQIQKKVLEGYNFYSGQNVTDAFKIVSIHPKITNNQRQKYLQKIINLKNQNQNNQENQQQSQAQKAKKFLEQMYYKSSIVTITTKCGYIMNLRHKSQSSQQISLKQDNFMFMNEPFKIPQTIGQSSLFQAKGFPLSLNQKQSRKNYLVQSQGIDGLSIMNNMLVYLSDKKISMLKIRDLKKNISKVETEGQSFWLTYQQFEKQFGVHKIKAQSAILQDNPAWKVLQDSDKINHSKNIKLSNFQTKWTVFDNKGEISLHLLNLRHILMIYLFFKCQNKSTSSIERLSFVEFDFKFQVLIQKMIGIYGLCEFSKALLQILVNNEGDKRQYFYVQQELLEQVVKKEYDLETPLKFEDWMYDLRSQTAKIIVPSTQILNQVWVLLFEYQHKPILPTETVSTYSLFSQANGGNPTYSNMLEQFEQFFKQKSMYGCFGYALQMFFSETVSETLYFRARDYKIKYKMLKHTQQRLIDLKHVLQAKKIKQNSPQYKHYLIDKMNSVNKSKSAARKQAVNYMNKDKVNLNSTLSTIHTYLDDSITLNQYENDTETLVKSVGFLQVTLNSSINKMVTLIKVMSVLIEKDQREGLPSFYQIITNYQNQLLIGREFFAQQLYEEANHTSLIHETLVRQAAMNIPQLEINKKIQYLRFKNLRNLRKNSILTQVDLKGLNIDKLYEITDSYQVVQLRGFILGNYKDFSQRKYHCYLQFLTLCMIRTGVKVRSLQKIVSQKFQDLNKHKMNKNKNVHNRKYHSYEYVSSDRIIVIKQQLNYQKLQLLKYYEQMKKVFTEVTTLIRQVQGTKYKEIEQYIQYVIRTLCQNFSHQIVVMQFLEAELKRVSLLEKVAYMRKLLSGKLDKKGNDIPILKVEKQKQFKSQQPSTFQTLKLFTMGKNDTLSTMNSTKSVII